MPNRHSRGGIHTTVFTLRNVPAELAMPGPDNMGGVLRPAVEPGEEEDADPATPGGGRGGRTTVQGLPLIANAQSSTGPRTEAGKAASSQNGLTLGLFTASDFVRPADQPAYAQLAAELYRDLAPVGALERNLVDEIRRAMWRLRRCGEVEFHLVLRLDNEKDFILDPMEAADPRAEKILSAP